MRMTLGKSEGLGRISRTLGENDEDEQGSRRENSTDTME